MIVLFFPFARDLTYLYKRLRYTYVHGPKINFNVEIIGVTFWIKIPIDHANRDLSPTLRARRSINKRSSRHLYKFHRLARGRKCTRSVLHHAVYNDYARHEGKERERERERERKRKRVYWSVDRNFARDECRRAVKEFTMFVSRDVGNTSRGLYVDKTKLSSSDSKSRTFVRDIFLRTERVVSPKVSRSIDHSNL